MKTIISVLATFILCASSFAFASGKCSAHKLATAQKKVSEIINSDQPKTSHVWEKLNKSFSGNRDCMAIYETYDFGEAIRHLMKNHWDQIGELEKYKSQDSDFFQFVISALKDETADTDDIKQIHDWAKSKCPAGAQMICKEIINSSQ